MDGDGPFFDINSKSCAGEDKYDNFWNVRYGKKKIWTRENTNWEIFLVTYKTINMQSKASQIPEGGKKIKNQTEKYAKL